MASSSASSSRSSNYDVFLNFRGEDTRNNFTGFLHKALKNTGINVFFDSENLWVGEAIGPSLLRAIEGSKISIPIFSKGYASSKWCLLELSHILHSHKSNGQMVLPIFFDVEPSHVRNQTGSFEKPFRKHKKHFKPHIVENWRDALRVVGNLKGWVLKDDANGDQAKLVELVVERVLGELISSIHLDECKYPIGIDSRVNDLLSLLNIGSNGIQFVGICGFGGIGKTTLAKAVYNLILLSFNRYSFLSDIREQATQCMGLVSLQKRLLKDIFRRDIDIADNHRGKKLIEQSLCKEKVLVVLDDVDSQEHLDALAGALNWFGQGSMVIITTRDEHILHLAKVDNDKIYRPRVLNLEQSLQLFSWHAFSSEQPPEDYMQLSHDVAFYSQGLPLTIEVLGSSLSGISSKKVWESTLQTLIEIPHEKIHRRLKISYDNLENDYQKAIFLDVACFFIGWPKETVISIWEACGYHPESAIHTLIKRSLLKFEGCYLRMHDQIRDMGREIVLEESFMEPGKRSRLWSHNEILEVLEEHKGTNMMKGMILPADLPRVSLDNKHFEMMSNLRFLDIESEKAMGVFSRLPSALRWFRWKSCPWDILPTNLYHKRLVYLNLSGSKIKQAWNIRPQDENMVFQKLKVLDLRECRSLYMSPDFSWFPCLERLDLGNCDSFYKLDESIGQLSHLKSLILQNCRQMKKFPNTIGDLKSLVELQLSGSGIKELPNGVGLLEKIEVFDASRCNGLVKLPRSMGRMRCLRSINLQGTNISKFPDDFSMLSNLEELEICQPVYPIPSPFYDILPVYPGPGSSVPGQLAPALRQRHRSRRPHHWGSGERAVDLPRHKAPYTFGGQIIGRQRVTEHFDRLWELEYLPELPSSLVELCCENLQSLVRLPDLSMLKKLRTLNLKDCKRLEEIRGLEGTESLEELDVQGCYNLTRTPWKIHGQGTLLPCGLPRNRYSLTAKDGIDIQELFLCVVLGLRTEMYQPEDIDLDISACIYQKDKTVRCFHTLRIEGVERTIHGDTIYIHHFKGFDWFGIPLQGKDAAIEILDIRGTESTVKFWKLLFENREPDQQKLDQHSSAMMVSDFFNWLYVNDNGEVLSLTPSLTCCSQAEVEGSSSDTKELEEEERVLTTRASDCKEASVDDEDDVALNDGSNQQKKNEEKNNQ